jgi:hypothetical protein
MHNSGGVIYKFDGINFDRIDESFFFNSQYQSFPFTYNDNVYNFGGYGLFTFKNIITYFNKSKKETELINSKTPISKLPFGRKKMFAQLEKNKLFIGAGYSYDNDIPEGTKKAKVLKDYWEYDLITNEWKKLGEGARYLHDDSYRLVYDFNGKTLVLTIDKVFVVDIKNNTIDFYENANIDLLKSSKKDAVRNLITYNKHKNGFYLVLDKPNFDNKLLFVSTEEFLGKPTRSEILYSEATISYQFYWLLGILIIVFVFLIIRDKDSFKKISFKRKEIDQILNEEEKQIFNLIYDKYPEFIPFPDLIDVFESHLSYESRKKKLRSSLYQIEDKILKVLKSKNKVFVERKNKEDLRIKEIRIK